MTVYDDDGNLCVIARIDTEKANTAMDNVYRKLGVFDFDDDPEESLKKWNKGEAR